MSKPLAIGIDLGTTYSAVAHLDQAGQPRTLSNAEGEMLTPSVLLFENDQVIVGKEALKAVATDADRVAQCIKRELGRRVFEKELGGRQYPPEALQGWVLNKLRRDASHALGGFTQAVITVPAYFDEVRRKATQDAGYIAGLEVMDIINEPTAAAIAFGFRQGLFSESLASARPSRILVYDLGGGTFDVTVMEINGNKFIALATDGDVQLGGYDWDQRLVNLVADEFTRRFDTDPRADENTLGRLWRDCEDAKRTLSARPQVSVPCDYKGDSVRIEITRQQFEEATRDLVDRTAFTTRQTLQAAGLTWKEIDRVLLVGGSTRMPAIVELLRELSQLEPDASVSADEAVAHGAALHAGHLIAKHQGRVPPFTVQNVNSHSLGVVAMDPSTKRDRNAILIPRNTPLPVTAKRVFKTQSDGQKSVLVQIVEGESPSPEHCVQLGRCTVRGIPPDVPAQTPIEVRFQYEENGRLTIMVNITGANAWTQHQITRENSMTTEDLETWRHFVTRGSQPKSIQ